MPSCVYFFGSTSMVVPFSNRAAVARIPELALVKGPATVKEVIDDFAKQCQPFSSVLECVQLVRGRTLRIHFPNTYVREDITSGGLTFRGHPLAFTVPTSSKWVSVLDLPYGTPEGEISSALSKFGQIASIRSETYKGLYTGTKLVKMTIKSAIPSRLAIAGHVCTVFYRGQVRSCFRCGVSGHEAKKCPRKASTQLADSRPAASIPDEPTGAMLTTPPSSPRSFANVVSGQDPPTVIATPSPRRVSPVTLPLPSSPTPGPVTVSSMDMDMPSNKRPYSPVSESEWTDTDEGDRSRPRLEAKQPTAPTLLDENIRDRSPHRTTVVGNDSSSDSSGESLTPKASVIDPPAAQQVVTGDDSSSDSSGKSPASTATVIVPPAAQQVVTLEPPLQPTGTLDRRPLSIRYREYCSAAPEYSKEEEDALVQSVLDIEHQLQHPSYSKREAAELQFAYDHLRLDFSIAASAYEVLEESDPRLAEFEHAMNQAEEDLKTFEEAYPELVQEVDNSAPPPD